MRWQQDISGYLVVSQKCNQILENIAGILDLFELRIENTYTKIEKYLYQILIAGIAFVLEVHTMRVFFNFLCITQGVTQHAFSSCCA